MSTSEGTAKASARRSRRPAIRLLKWLLVVIVVAVAAPFVVLAGYGFAHGLDVGNAFRVILADALGDGEMRDDDVTIDPASIDYHRPKAVRWRGNIENLQLAEASGLASAVRAEGILWAINDSGNEPALFAMGLSGDDLGRWRLDLPQPGDWEALATFEWDGDAYLVVADVGDNYRWRPELRIFVVPEPIVGQTPTDEVIGVAWSIRFRYPQGYRDCEAVAVDEDEGQILLISKRVVPAEVYSVPIKPAEMPGAMPGAMSGAMPGETVVTARKIALLDSLPQPNARDLYESPSYGPGRSQPTGFAIAGNRAVVVTYKDAYLYERQDGEPWAQALSARPRRIALPRVAQREAVALARDGSRFFTTTERANGTDAAGIYEIEF